MSPTFFTRTLITIAIILVAIGFLFSQSILQEVKSNMQCNLNNQKQCELINNTDNLTVEFLQNIELEEELKLHITSSPTLKIKKIWVQGVNMYMGKTAVFIDSTSETSNEVSYDATLFLGACSEPNMKWQLIIQTENPAHLEQSWFFNFDTARN